MKIVFRISNGTSQIILIPEGERDKRCIELCRSGKETVSIAPSIEEGLIIELKEEEKK